MEYDPTKEKIIKAAIEVVAEKTISGTRMHLIAEAAGMSTATLHYHFNTKDDLLKEMLRYLINNFRKTVEEMLSTVSNDLGEKFAHHFDIEKDIIEKDKAIGRLELDFWTLGQIDPEINGYIQEMLFLWRKDIIEYITYHMPGQDPARVQTASEIMVSMMVGALFQFLNANVSYDIDRYFADCCKMLGLYLSATQWV